MADLLASFVVIGFFAVCGALVHIDVTRHRLPNAVVAPLAVGVAAGLALAAAVGGSAGPLLRALAGGLVLGAAFLALRDLTSGGLGGGDVKLAVPVGMVLAWHGWLPLAIGAAASFLLAGLAAAALIAGGRGTRRTRIAFGPWMALGTAAGLLLT